MNRLKDAIKTLNINKENDINILLLGQTGIGKSTFINAIANYLTFEDFKKAQKGDPHVLIPATITFVDKHYETHVIKVGKVDDKNEVQDVGESATQDVKTYVFPIGASGKTRIRLIDTPGMEDTRGIEQDDANCENILSHISMLKDLHGICFLMKPTTTRRTAVFEYCIKQILSRLDKSAANNIIFIFTNTRGSNYNPGDTLHTLRRVIDDINSAQNIKIPYRYEPNGFNNNIYCVDNEAFRFLMASQAKDIEIEEGVKKTYIESWKTSTAECWRLINYILGDGSHDPLPPHQMKNTVCVNEARKMVTQLSQPLAEISQLIFDNIRILERQKQNLNSENQSLDELKKHLYIPVVNLKVTKLTQPVTVCTAGKCSELYQVGILSKWHYRQRCHDPCYLTNVTKEVIGDPQLINCAAMSGSRNCQKCTCDYSIHMHVYYMTKTVEENIEDEVVVQNINDKKRGIQEAEKIMKNIDQRKSELESERETIVKSTAQFAHFLQNNAITPYNDAYEKYIEYLIDRERSLGRQADHGVIANLEKLLRQYTEIKEAFDKSLQLQRTLGADAVSSYNTPESIMKVIQKLYTLKHNGKKIRELMTTQKTSREAEYQKNCEYVHPSTSTPQTKNKKGEEQKQSNNKQGGPPPKGQQHRSFPPKWQPRGPQPNFRNNNPPPYNGPPRGSYNPPPQGSYNPPRQGSYNPPPLMGSQNPQPQGSYNPPPAYTSSYNAAPPAYQPPDTSPSDIHFHIKVDHPQQGKGPSPDDRNYGSRPDNRDHYRPGPDRYDYGPNHGDYRSGPSNRGPYPDNRGPYPDNRGPYPDNRGPYPANRGPYPDNRGPYPDNRGPYPDNRGPYPDNRGPYPDNRGPYPDNRGPYPDNRGPYPDNRGPYPDNRAPYPDNRGGYAGPGLNYQDNRSYGPNDGYGPDNRNYGNRPDDKNNGPRPNQGFDRNYQSDQGYYGSENRGNNPNANFNRRFGGGRQSEPHTGPPKQRGHSASRGFNKNKKIGKKGNKKESKTSASGTTSDSE